MADRFLHAPLRRSAAFAAALSAFGCAGPSPEKPVEPALPSVAREQFQTHLDGGFVVDYQVERKISALDRKSCFAFITGTLTNTSTRTLGRRSILDVTVFSQGKPLFRDLTSPVRDVPPGTRVMFEMVVSPVHKGSCPSYDRIDISLRHAPTNKAPATSDRDTRSTIPK